MSSRPIEKNNACSITKLNQAHTRSLHERDCYIVCPRVNLDVRSTPFVGELSRIHSLHGEFSRFSSRDPESQHFFAINNSVGKNLRRRVKECLRAELEVRDNDLGLVTVESDLGAILRNSNLSRSQQLIIAIWVLEEITYEHPRKC